MGWTVGLYGLDLSAITYILAALLFYFGGSMYVSQRRMGSQYIWFLVSSGVQVYMMNTVWHTCNDGEYCFAWQGKYAVTDDINEQPPLIFDTLTALLTSLSFNTLFIPTPLYNLALLSISLCLLLIFQSMIPGFTSGTWGIFIYGAFILIMFLCLTWRYVVITKWFAGIWLAMGMLWGLAIYMKSTEEQHYYTRHFIWHMGTGFSEIIGVLGWLGLASQGVLLLEPEPEETNLQILRNWVYLRAYILGVENPNDWKMIPTPPQEPFLIEFEKSE